jgi:hypothetical protein
MIFVSAILLALLYAGAVSLLQKQPARNQLIIVAGLSLVIGLAHGLIAKAHYTNPVSVMSNHSLNNFVVVAGYTLAAIGLGNIAVSYKYIRLGTIILGFVLAMLPVMYFLS